MFTGIELYSHATKSELADFGGEFAGFLRSAKRLEVLPAYNVAQEHEALQVFRNGGHVDPSFNTDWHGILDGAAKRGANVDRVRVVPAIPTEYLRFEIICGYVQSTDRGERQHFVEENDFASILGADVAAPDFWLFDDERAYLMMYDPRGSFMGVMKVDAAATANLHRLYETLAARSRDLPWAVNEYLLKT